MIIAVDWDGTVVQQDGRPYEDTTSPFVFMPGAREALAALKRAGHTLVLYSARANRALRLDPRLDPLVRSGKRKARSPESVALNQARYEHMVAFVERELPGVFDAIDDGSVGKVSADLYVDDRALRYGTGLRGSSWQVIATEHGVVERRRK